MQASAVVCFIHGLACRPAIMRYLAYKIKNKSFSTCFFGYASLTRFFEENVNMLEHYLEKLPYQRIHCVAHSLGGLILLKALERFPSERIKRVVLLGAPLQGSQYATHLMRYKIGRLLLGKSGFLWGNIPQFVLPTGTEVGIIAGNRCSSFFNIFRVASLEFPNDGIVSICETQVPGVKDSIILPVSHLRMLFSRQVAEAVGNFLKKGTFA